jgi:predicted nucleotidyltransferase
MDAGLQLTSTEAQVLVALLRMDTPLSGRAIARITGLTQATARRALVRLREVGLVAAEAVPPALLYRANHDHLAMPALLALLRLGSELRARVAEQVGGWRVPPMSALIYGSFARGELATHSDVDVLVVRPDTVRPDDTMWQGQIADLADRIQRWTGRRANVIDMDIREAVRGLSDREPFLVEVDKHGWLIAGRTISELAEGRT